MKWIIVQQNNHQPLNEVEYSTEIAAQSDINKLGSIISTMYEAVPHITNMKWKRLLLEGLSVGDLEGILLPQFSVDLYVPGDADTDNIVIGFLIKGVPEAVYPFKNFCEYAPGVDNVDYGDSDTIPDTSLVYVEFDRDNFKLSELTGLIREVSRLSYLNSEDFMITFPTSNKKYPFSLEILEKYFQARSRNKNLKAQKQAVQDRTRQIQQELEKELESGKLGNSINPQQPITTNVPNTNLNSTGVSVGKKSKIDTPHIQTLVGFAAPKKTKGLKAADVPEPIKLSIISDARRNRTNRTETWKNFDKRWALRLRVSPNKIASIRKKVYENYENEKLINRLVEMMDCVDI